MNKYKYLLGTLFKIGLLWLIAALYKIGICFFSDQFQEADLICYLNWKDGFIFIICYSLVMLTSLIIKLRAIRLNLLLSFLLYILFYGIFAFPYLISSFIQPLIVNSLFHTIVLITILEIYFWNSIKGRTT